MTPTSATLRSRLHDLLWVMLGIAFVCIGARPLSQILEGNDSVLRAPPAIPKRFGASYYSSDYYFAACAGTPGASRRIVGIFDSAKSQQPILVVTRQSGANSAFLGMLTSYLAWPRSVRTMKVPSPGCEKEMAAIPADSVSAVAFCEVQAPASLRPIYPVGRYSSIFVAEKQN